MAKNAHDSFKKFHPDIDAYVYNPYTYVESYEGRFPPKVIGLYPPGICKFILGLWTTLAGGYERVIILGADTITCSRLDEFFIDYESDFIGTLDYNYPLAISSGFGTPTDKPDPAFLSPMILDDEKRGNNIVVSPNPLLEDITDERELINPETEKNMEAYKHLCKNSNLYKFQFVHLNADVVCFNNLKFLKYVIDFATQNIQPAQRFENNIPPGFVNQYYEQGSLNFCTFAGWSETSDDILTIGKEKLCFKSKDLKVPKVYIPELHDESVIYNVRSHAPQRNIWKQYQDQSLYENFTFPTACEKDYDFIKEYYVEDNKLYTSEGKQIKVWHYCDDFGGQRGNEFIKLEKKWIDIFNEETKNFFSNNCDCGDYFK